ncbi:MAG: serine--tRNA ligase [Candidatus Woesearchaeota archaeon]
MLDINYIRRYPDVVRENLRRRQVPEYLVYLDSLLKTDELWRSLKQKVDQARARRNKISQEINEAKKSGKDASKIIREAAEIPKIIAQAEKELADLQEKMKTLLYKIPNLVHQSVPYGRDDTENKVIKTVGKKPSFRFTPLSHVDLMMKNNWVDLDRAAKIAGARWYFLKGDLAILELALVKYAMDFMRKKGFTPVIPPYMMSHNAYNGVVSLDDFENVMYKIQGEDLYAIATSEHPLTAMHMDEVLEERDLPVKLAGFSTNFRKEAGAHGRDQKGIFRVHQFSKVEQIVICKPEESWHFHEELLNNAVEFFESLGLHFRVVNVCTGDLGIIAAKKYDLEAWYPVQDAFREVVSCSNCTSYQAVRSNIRFQHGNERLYVHTLNSTCVATTRALVAIMENFQNDDGSVEVPKVLQKYAGFKIMK